MNEILNNDREEVAAGGEEGKEDEPGDEDEDFMCTETNAGDFRTMRKLQDPKLPSKAEVEAHNLNHLPFRSWCRHCVRGRGEEEPHRKVGGREEGAMPEVHLDFAFPGSHGQAGLTLLVARERDR